MSPSWRRPLSPRCRPPLSPLKMWRRSPCFAACSTRLSVCRKRRPRPRLRLISRRLRPLPSPISPPGASSRNCCTTTHGSRRARPPMRRRRGTSPTRRRCNRQPSKLNRRQRRSPKRPPSRQHRRPNSPARHCLRTGSSKLGRGPTSGRPSSSAGLSPRRLRTCRPRSSRRRPRVPQPTRRPRRACRPSHGALNCRRLTKTPPVRSSRGSRPVSAESERRPGAGGWLESAAASPAAFRHF